jgi:hypothetical protein
MGDEQNGQGWSRPDRLEGLMELLDDRLKFDHLKFSDEHKRLLTAQVLLTETQQRAEKKMAELAEAQKDTAERLNALIAVVDDLVRRDRGRLQ